MTTAKDLFENGIVTEPPVGDKDFELCPSKMHNAVCAIIMDLGHVEKTYDDKPKIVHQIKFGYLTEELDSEERPFILFSRPLTLTSSDRGNLYKYVKSWNVVPMGFEENGSFAINFLPTHIGMGALLNITHNEYNDKTYANIETVNPPMGECNIPFEGDERIQKMIDNMAANGGVYVRKERNQQQQAPAHGDEHAPADDAVDQSKLNYRVPEEQEPFV